MNEFSQSFSLLINSFLPNILLGIGILLLIWLIARILFSSVRKLPKRAKLFNRMNSSISGVSLSQPEQVDLQDDSWGNYG